MGRVVGIDYGSKKIGVSIADPLRLFAQSVGTYTRSGCLSYLRELGESDGIDTIVVGWPDPGGEAEGSVHDLIRAWVAELRSEFSHVDIVLVDESYSSREAEALLASSGHKKKKRRERGRVDQAAAAIILQRYLDQTL